MKKTPSVMRTLAGDLMYELDALYASTEMILSGRFREPPLDGFLLEACLLHFRVVWDFFYPPNPKRFPTDIIVGDYMAHWTAPKPPAALVKIRNRVDVMSAHLTSKRANPDYRKRDTTMDDINRIRAHTQALFTAFKKALPEDQRGAFVNPLEQKFVRYETLRV
jgi:hypothetical protein